MLKRLVLVGLFCLPLSSMAFTMNVVADVEAADGDGAENCSEHRGRGMSEADHLRAHVDEQNCTPSGGGLEILCNNIDSHAPESSGSQNRYVYQTRILRAACVAHNDSPEERNRKINDLWNRHGMNISCNLTRPGFTPGGNLLKLAVAKEFTAFVVDAARNWRVNLNRVDTDGLTVYDYVLREKAIAERNNTPALSKLIIYERLLREAGARRRADLR